MTFGNVSITPKAFKDVTREEFIQMYKGKMDYDINKAWDELQIVLKDSRPYENIETKEHPIKMDGLKKKK